MANTHTKTTDSNRQRTADESPMPIGEVESGDQTMKPSSDPAAENEVESDGSDGDSDADWGFDSKSSGMSKEMKIGIPVLVLLVAVFGYFVYDKFATTEIEPQETIGKNETETEMGEGSETPPGSEDNGENPDGNGENNPPSSNGDNDGLFSGNEETSGAPGSQFQSTWTGNETTPGRTDFPGNTDPPNGSIDPSESQSPFPPRTQDTAAAQTGDSTFPQANSNPGDARDSLDGDPFSTKSNLVGEPSSVDPMFDSRTGKSMTADGTTVAVVCYAPSQVQFDFQDIDKEIAEYVALHLHEHKIKVANPEQVHAWMDENSDWVDPSEIGRALGVTYVIYIDIQEFSLYDKNSTNLFRGRTEGWVNVIEMDESGNGAKIFSRELTAESTKYPLVLAKSTTDVTPQTFKQEYLSSLSLVIGQPFHENDAQIDPRENVERDLRGGPFGETVAVDTEETNQAIRRENANDDSQFPEDAGQPKIDIYGNPIVDVANRQSQETSDSQFQTGTASNARSPFEQNDIQPDANRDQTPLENRAGSITTIQTPANDFKQESTPFEDFPKASQSSTADAFERPFDERETGDSTDSDRNSQFDQNSVTRSKAPLWDKLPSSSGLGQIGTSHNAARRPFDSESSTSLDEYTVQQNDSYWKISTKRYGTYRYFQALLMYNKDRISDPRRMRPGMKIRTPDPQILHARFPKAIPSGSGQGTVVRKSDPTDGNAATGFFVGKTGAPYYRIGPRDDLARIAKRHLGRSSRWIQILNLNKSQLKNPHNLKIGTILKLPSDASDVQLVGRTPETR